jgi:hypothetical protein
MRIDFIYKHMFKLYPIQCETLNIVIVDGYSRYHLYI